MHVVIDSKTCRECKEEKPLSDYYKHPKTEDKRTHVCKICYNNKHRAAYAEGHKRKGSVESRWDETIRRALRVINKQLASDKINVALKVILLAKEYLGKTPRRYTKKDKEAFDALSEDVIDAERETTRKRIGEARTAGGAGAQRGDAAEGNAGPDSVV